MAKLLLLGEIFGEFDEKMSCYIVSHLEAVESLLKILGKILESSDYGNASSTIT